MSSLVSLSRPRFWMYVIGPYIIGATSAFGQEGTLPWIGVFFAWYFTLPANALIYGINDLFDYETDVLNEKKQGYESVFNPARRAWFLRWLFLLHIPLVCVLPFLSPLTWLYLGLFFFFGIFYSAPPLRFKTRPFLDSFSNILYLFPGFVGYTVYGGTTYSWPLILAAALWIMAMHAYSAVPDITADKRAGLRTIATTLGARGTLWGCFLCYVLSGILTALFLHPIGILGAIVYGGLMLRSLHVTQATELFSVYQKFPLVNTIMGALLFLVVFLR